MTLSDSLPAACHFTALAYRFAFYDTVVRGRVSLVPDTTFTACRSLYTGGFFRAACPESSHVPWPSPVHTRLDILLSLAGFKLTMRQDSLHVAACNFASPFWVFHRASPLGSHHQVPASYEAVWSLPRPDSHRLVVPSFARRAVVGLTLTDNFTASSLNSLSYTRIWIPSFFCYHSFQIYEFTDSTKMILLQFDAHWRSAYGFSVDISCTRAGRLYPKAFRISACSDVTSVL